MERPESIAFLHDTGVGRGIDVARLLAEDHELVELPDELPDDPDRIMLEIHTAANDGSVDIERWTAAELDRAIDAIIDRLELATSAVVVHGFTPTFAPAVLVGTLAPLAVGGSFLLAAPESIADLVAAAGTNDGSLLLCSPAEVRAFAALPAGAWKSVARIACFGPPPAGVADALATLHDVAVEPILIEQPDDVDACVERLFLIEGVADAAVARLPGDAVALVAIVGPDSALLSARAAAAAVFAEDVELLVRAFPELPRGPNGRVPHGDFCALFGRGRDGRPVTREIEWHTEPQGENGTRRFRARIPERYTYFAGHFTSYPVLAGGVQVQELVLPCVRAAEFAVGSVERLDAVKFLARIAPGDEIAVVLHHPDDQLRVQFEIWCGDTRCTTGRISFAEVEKDRV